MLKLHTTRHKSMPNGWEMKDTIRHGRRIVASVIYWPWSERSCERAEEILTHQLRAAGYTWEDVKQNF